MRVTMATSAGHGRTNEDFVGAVPGAVVLLDGAGIVGTESICHHGVAWYSHTLGATLLARLALADDTALDVLVAESIEVVAGLHRHTCDIADPSSPQSTVALLRFTGDRADYLVLADSFVVLDSLLREPQVITDPREVAVRRECTTAMRGLGVGTVEYERARALSIDELRARRNQAGGYWIAKDDPRSAAEAVTGTVPLSGLNGAALLTNGAYRLVDPYGSTGPAELLTWLRDGHPDEVLHRLRDVESAAVASGALPGFASPDDATVAYADAGSST